GRWDGASAFPGDARGVHVPDFRGPSAELIAHVFGGTNDRHAGGVTDAAAAGDVGMAGRVGVCHTRADALDWNAELLGHHLCLRDPRAADVRIAGEHGRAPVQI